MSQRGFTYLCVLVAIAVLGMGLVAASEVWQTKNRRLGSQRSTQPSFLSCLKTEDMRCRDAICESSTPTRSDRTASGRWLLVRTCESTEFARQGCKIQDPGYVNGFMCDRWVCEVRTPGPIRWTNKLLITYFIDLRRMLIQLEFWLSKSGLG